MTQIIINETTPVVVEVSTPGPQGSSGTATVGTVTTGASGSAAAVTNSGTPSAAVFNFTIPKGDIGDVTPAATAAKNAAEAATIAAAASELAAETAEQAAEDSATAALASANQASASASTAGTKAQEATDSASTAYSAAIAANLSRNVASAASTNANNKAAAALASANTASTKAQEASASEVVASTKAQEAVVSATTATNKATEASASAATALSAQQVTTDNATLAIAQANIAGAKAAAANTSANDALVQASVATAQAAEATTQANTATTQAGIATTQATTATTQAGIASTQANTAIAQAAIATTKASEASVSASNSQDSASAALASQTASAASAAAANTSAGNASGSAASALAIYGTTAAQQAALTNAQSAASLAQGYALSASSAIQQDLSGVTAQALHRSPNAVTAMFVYDTSKDSDGGAWTEKCQHTSWYNEALNGKWLGAQVSEFEARNAGSTVSSELLVNGTFDSNVSIWTAESQAALSWQNGSAFSLATGGSRNIYQSIPTVVGRTYRFVVTVSGGTGGRVRVGTAIAGTQHIDITPQTGTLTYTRFFVASATTTFVTFFSAGDSVQSISVDNISVKEVVADRSYKSATAPITGTLTKTQVAAASQLVAYSGFSAANYLREPYSADLDFGTGEWSCGAWVNYKDTVKNIFSNSNPTWNGAGTSSFVTYDGYASVTSVTLGAASNTRYGRFESSANVISDRYTVGFLAALSRPLGAGERIYIAMDGGQYQGNQGIDITNVGTLQQYSFAFNATATNGTLPYIQASTLFSELTVYFTRPQGNPGVSLLPFVQAAGAPAYTVNTIADRSHASGPRITLSEFQNKLTATAFDGTTTRTVTTTAAYNTATWIKPEAVYTTDGTLAIRVNGVEVAATRGAPLLSLNAPANLQRYSQTWSTAGSYWQYGVSYDSPISTLTDVDPLGGNTALTCNYNASTASRIQMANLPLVANTPYTASFWLKSSSTANLELKLYDSVDFRNPIVISPTDVWTKYTVTATSLTTTSVGAFQIRNAGATARSVSIAFAQFEIGNSATAYKETSAAPVSDPVPLTIGNSFAADAPFPGSISLLKLSATVPTAEQSVWMYEQEKQMFRDGAQVTLPDAGSIVDLAYDDATDKWLAVSATNESEWSGLVRTSVTPSPAGSYSKISAASGIQLQARTTTNPGVDVTIPSYGLREELVNRSQAAAKLARTLVSFDYVGGFTANTTSGSTAITSAANITYPVSYVGARVSGSGIPADTFVAAISGTTIYLTKAATATATAVQISFNDFILPVGYEAKDVLLAGVSQREGATQAFTRLFDGFKETIRFTTAPSNTAFVQIQATRSIQ